ncbi:NADPH:quinone reductase [Streptomyces sp. NBC_01485]|uniref:NADPH:quinone reductase n=1 Tax=Streptomyces sp. NBC_01485 TaxID=2903884 RepID=UPI002E3231C2|nr:NADPH:quinone reductase [Streptomyces sp. NBC_01485]
MKAAYIEEFGAADGIRFGELAPPVGGPTDVMVDVVATTVNPVDTFVRSGAWRTPVTFPFVVGRDVVGTVAAIGAGVSGFTVGDVVWCNSLGHGGRQGAAAERVVVPVDRLYRLPDGVSPVDAAPVLHPAATAYLALFTRGALRVGESVLVVGAGGNVGGAAVVLAAEAGARVLATARADDEKYCRGLGAEGFVDYHAPELADRCREFAPHGFNVVVDAAGWNDLETVVGLLAFRGRVVVLAGLRSRPVLPVGPLYLKDGSVTGFVISRATTAELADAARTLNRLLARGRLRSRAVEEAPLSAAAEVHARLERGQLHGRRVVLRPGLDAT